MRDADSSSIIHEIAESMGVHVVEASRLNDVVSLGAQAFAGTGPSAPPEPIMDWVLGQRYANRWGNPRRKQHAEWALRVIVNKAFADGYVVVAPALDGSIGAVCCFQLRGKMSAIRELSEMLSAVAKTGLPPWTYHDGGLCAREGREETGRCIACGNIEDELHARHAREAHLYVQIMAVSPYHQGQGLSSKVMRAISAIADRKGLPCYLDACGDRLSAIYSRFGYTIAEQKALADGGPTYLAMLRQPMTVAVPRYR